MPAMRYVMKQKLFSFGDDFAIKDGDGNTVYTVDGKVFSIGDKLIFEDKHGNEVARVEEKIISIGPTYEISRGGKQLAIVKKSLFTLFSCSFTVDVPGPDDLEAKGSFTDHDYAFKRGGKEVARVSKKWFSITDSYGVDVADGEDDVLLLASTVVIDMCCHPDEKRR
jgi:uncharacterized protein YxjI